MQNDDNETIQRAKTSSLGGILFILVIGVFVSVFLWNMQQRAANDVDEESIIDQILTKVPRADSKVVVAKGSYDDPDIVLYKPSERLSAPRSNVDTRSYSIDEAYAAVPKERITFYARDVSHFSGDEAEYLESLFRLTDEGVRARVMLQISLYRGQNLMDFNEYEATMSRARAEHAKVDIPDRLAGVENLISLALEEQVKYLGLWSQQPRDQWKAFGDNMVRNPIAKSSSRKLIKAYSILSSMSRGEKPRIVKSYFSHLCALDFL